jgi:hypothetical protein
VIDTGAMRRLGGALAAVLLACTACTTTSDGDLEPAPTTTSPASDPSTSFAAVGIDWPEAEGDLEAADPPAAPAGFDAALIGRMADTLTEWAQVSTLDEIARDSVTPLDDIAEVLPAPVVAALRDQTKDAVSPRLAVANVFADDVTVVGAPRVTTAWGLSTQVDEAGRQYVLLELQTRAAYEVRLAVDSPIRVIGVLRVHGLSAYPDTTDDFGVSGGWQEFGAVDCALALDDDLTPDSDAKASKADLTTFVEVGDGDTLDMPSLDDEQQVDAQYLQRCRDSRT